MKKSFEILLFVLCWLPVIAFAAPIIGPSPVYVGTTHTYTYTSSRVMDYFWAPTKGVIISESENGLTYSVTIRWETVGSGSVVLKELIEDPLGPRVVTVASKVITISVCSPTAGSISGSTTVCYNQSTVLNNVALATGPGTISYQWEKNENGTGWINIPGATAIDYSTVNLTVNTAFRRASLCACATTYTSPTTVTVNPPLNPGLIGGNQTICTGSNPSTLTSVSSASDGNGSYNYQWQSSNDGSSWFDLTGATSTSYSPGALSISGYYRRAVSSCNETKYTPGIFISVKSLSVGGTVTPNISAFTTASGTITLSGHSGAVQKWQKRVGAGNWEDVSNTNSNLVFTNVTSTTAYRAIVQNSVCPPVFSGEALVTIYQAPTVTADATRIAMGSSVTLDAGSGYTTYTWRNLQNNVVGSSRYHVTSTADSYTVTVTLTGVQGSGVSNVLPVQSQFQGQSLNYIVSNTILKPGVTNELQVAGLTVDENSQSIQYFDGLGRSIQSVITQGSPDKKDIVQPVVYDAFGREAVKYLPFVSAETNGWYKSTAIAQQAAFYNNASDKVADDPSPFAVTIFEPSPLNRIIKQGAPGTAWQPDVVNTYNSTDHSIKKAYEFNTTNEVLLWSYSYPTTANPLGMVNASSGATPLYYAANQLYKNRTKDEHGNEVIEYTDKEGKTILKRVQAISGSPASNDSTYASTYFIYNDFNKEVCVIPPEAVKRITKSNSEYFGKTDAQKNDFLKRWAYRYTYDGRLRQTQKQLPGAETVYLVYNNRDLLIMTQDGNQRTQNKWMFTKYDVLNRPIVSGIYTHNTSIDQAAMSVLISTTNFYESYNSVTTTHGYSNTVFPIINADGSPLQILTVTYYDNYLFRDNLAGSAYNYVPGDLTGQATAFNRVTGLVTGTKVNVLGTTNYLWSVNYYDDKYRTIQTLAQNHKGGIDRVTNVYDFVGKVLESKTIHNNGIATHTIKNRFQYDHAGRLLKTWHKVNTENEVLLSATEYNSLGEAVTKKLHSSDPVSTPDALRIYKQYVDFRYNIRGWLTRINNSDLAADNATDPKDYFGMNLSYNDVVAGINNNAQFNGNISAIYWSNALGNVAIKQRGYKLIYDPLSRLIAATHQEKIGTSWGASTSFHEDNLTYDLQGNIKTLCRKGAAGTNLDNLVYNYGSGATASNKVLSIIENADKTKGFLDKNTTGDDYTYDGNANELTDKNKGISAIAWNTINRPEKITVTNGDYITFAVDANGSRLSKSLFSSTNVLKKKTDYVGDFVYENDTLKFIRHDEGRVMMTGTTEYQYELRDNKDNVRVMFTAIPGQDISKATLETINLTSEQSKFFRYENARRINSSLFDHTNGTGTGYAQRLNGSTNERYGLAKSLSVMPGDTVNMEVFVKYVDTNTSNWTAALNTMLSQIANGTAPAGTVVDGGGYSSSTSSFSYAGLLNTTGSSGVGPKAYLNWLIFDKNFAFVNGGFVRMSDVAREYGQDVTHEKLQTQLIINEPGYVYLYLSNENETPVDVFFDDWKITLAKSPLIQANTYYPFGMDIPELGYQREGSKKNNFLYNGRSELQDDLGLNVYLTPYRILENDAPRWWSPDPLVEEFYDQSPYNFSFNNPVRYNDPKGDCPPWFCGAIIGGLVEIGTQVAVKMANGQTLSEAASSIDWVDVGSSTLEGGLTGGASVLKKIAIIGASEGVKAAVNWTANEGLTVEKDVQKVATEAAIGTVFSTVGSQGGKALVNASTDAAVKSAKSSVTAANKNLTKAVNTVQNGNVQSKATLPKVATDNLTKAKNNFSKIKALNKTVGANKLTQKSSEAVVDFTGSIFGTVVADKTKK